MPILTTDPRDFYPFSWSGLKRRGCSLEQRLQILIEKLEYRKQFSPDPRVLKKLRREIEEVKALM